MLPSVQGSPQSHQWECFLVFGNFSLFKTPFLGQDSLPRMELPPHLLCLFLCLLYFFLPPFEDNGLLFWVPDVLCRHSEVVLWNLVSVQMFFWWICGGESCLPILFLCHLRTASSNLFLFMLLQLFLARNFGVRRKEAKMVNAHILFWHES